VTRSGDSLWTLAERILGPGASNRRIARLTLAIWERNQVRIGTHDPDVLPAGITIMLPKETR
jgi:hypothetical protein